MKTRIHAIGGGVAFLTIASFWLSTVWSETFGDAAAVAAVKTAVLYGMGVLIPALVITGSSGMMLGAKRRDPLARAKKRRMPLIATNGLLVLLPSAIYLAIKARAGAFDSAFDVVQVIELTAGFINIVMMGLNIRDGLRMTGRLSPVRATHSR
jgi:hypothetical protein